MNHSLLDLLLHNKGLLFFRLPMATRSVDGCIPEVNSGDCEFNNCPNCSGRKLIGAVVSGFDPKADQVVTWKQVVVAQE